MFSKKHLIPPKHGKASLHHAFLPRRFWLFLSLTLGQILLITLMSAQPGEQSSAFSDWVARLLGIHVDQEAASETVLLLGLSLRKFAHLTEYAVLAALLLLTLRAGCPWPSAWLVGLALAGSYLLACLDELHQRWVPGRSGQFKDTLIDGIGICLGLALTASLIWLQHKRQKSKRSLRCSRRPAAKPTDTAE
ncbi:MAG: VanZ family protein [Oscillospiraceae bacterium]|nr:VanZ family protein [Oscillospiraceae bacterium]